MDWIRETTTVNEVLEILPRTEYLLNWFGIETTGHEKDTLAAAAKQARFPIALIVTCLNRNLLRAA